MPIYQAKLSYRVAEGCRSTTFEPTYHATKRGACDALLALANSLPMTDAARVETREMLCRILETDSIISSGRECGANFDEYVCVSVLPKTVGA